MADGLQFYMMGQYGIRPVTPRWLEVLDRYSLDAGVPRRIAAAARKRGRRVNFFRRHDSLDSVVWAPVTPDRNDYVGSLTDQCDPE